MRWRGNRTCPVTVAPSGARRGNSCSNLSTVCGSGGMHYQFIVVLMIFFLSTCEVHRACVLYVTLRLHSARFDSRWVRFDRMHLPQGRSSRSCRTADGGVQLAWSRRMRKWTSLGLAIAATAMATT